MPAVILDGKSEARKIREEIKNEISELALKPRLDVIIVGDDPASHLYVSLKEKAANETGIEFRRYDYPAATDERTIIAKIAELNADPLVDGILVQLPLPEHLNPNAIIVAIDPSKDADGFHPKNMTGLLSPGIAGPLALIAKTNVDLKGKRVVVVGNSAVFTQSFCDPLRVLGARAEPTYPENADLMRKADVLIVAVGRPGFVVPEMIKSEAIVIDIGTNRVEDPSAPLGTSKTVGDISPEVANKASFITPVPGGVGPMTVAMLLKNVVELHKQRNSVEAEALPS
jgi:methylenetetrahydrofolate dehydrogenase (NADP+) / methenyltetrahydrofolate cyclohydrolase